MFFSLWLLCMLFVFGCDVCLVALALCLFGGILLRLLGFVDLCYFCLFCVWLLISICCVLVFCWLFAVRLFVSFAGGLMLVACVSGTCFFVRFLWFACFGVFRVWICWFGFDVYYGCTLWWLVYLLS